MCTSNLTPAAPSAAPSASSRSTTSSPGAWAAPAGPEIEDDTNKVVLCRTCHTEITEHRWHLERTPERLTVTDVATGNLVARRHYDPGFQAPAYFARFQTMEQGLSELLFGIPYLTDEQLVELYQSVGSFDRGAWKAKAAILWEAKQRSTYGDKAWEAVGKTFGIGWRQAYNLARVWQTFFVDEEGQFCNQMQNCALDEVSWYITTAETDDPKFWLAYAEDRKAEHPFYTVADLKDEIRTGRREAGGRRQLRHRHPELPLGARLLRAAGPGGEPGALWRLRAAPHPREGDGDRMTTFTYEEKLISFADGKRLRRFRGYLRAPSKSTCDACGSTLPSYLHALRDIGAGRDYFVGGNCYVRLHQLGVLERPYVRASIATAYLRARGEQDELHLYFKQANGQPGAQAS